MAQQDRFKLVSMGNKVREQMKQKEAAQLNATELSKELSANSVDKTPEIPPATKPKGEVSNASIPASGTKTIKAKKNKGGRGEVDASPRYALKSINVSKRLHYQIYMRMMQTGVKTADEFIGLAVDELDKKLKAKYGEVVYPPDMD